MKNEFIKCGHYHVQTKLKFIPVLGGYRNIDTEVGVCYGTRECDECSCGGNQLKCTHYASVRKEAKEQLAINDVMKKSKKDLDQKKYVPEIGDMKKIDPKKFSDMQDLITFHAVENNLVSINREGKLFIIDKSKKLSYVMIVENGSITWYKTGSDEDWEKYRGKNKK